MNAVNYFSSSRAERKKIHHGEEAQVSRISCASPFFNGLVERKERLDAGLVGFD